MWSYYYRYIFIKTKTIYICQENKNVFERVIIYKINKAENDKLKDIYCTI